MADGDEVVGTGDPSDDTGIDAEAPGQEIVAETAEGAIAETVPGAAAETAQPSVYDLLAALPDEELDAVLTNERLKFKVSQREDSARQKERDRIARDSASSEQASAILDDLLLRARDADDLTEIKKLSATVVQRNRAFEAHALATTIADLLVGDYGVPPEVHKAALDLREAGDHAGYLRTLHDGAVSAKLAVIRAEDEKKNTADVNRRVAAETAAMRAELAPKREGAPSSPRGGAPGAMTLQQIDAMPTNEWLAKPIAEQRRLIEDARAAVSRR